MVFWLRKARVRTPSSPQTQAGEKPGLTCRWFHACELSDGFRGMRPKPGHLDSGPGLLWELLRKKSFLSPRRWSWSSEDVGLDLTGAGSQSAWEGRRRAERRECGPLNPAASTRLSQTLGGASSARGRRPCYSGACYSRFLPLADYAGTPERHSLAALSTNALGIYRCDCR